ncbi:MAG TPA: glycosyltransferase family 39 protein [Solirubrobacterales bacterium]|nr:glycosyltransferase family 39 protein [Solirubrobacterales bacterium]
MADETRTETVSPPEPAPADAGTATSHRRRLPAWLQGERGRWLLIIAVACLLLAAMDAWWVVAHRHGYPLDVDESGYTTIGLNDYFGLKNGGLNGWWEAFQNQTPNAPLLPAVTSIALLLNPGILAGFIVLIGFVVLLVFASYGIGEQLAGPRLGALVALAVGTCAGAFTFTREYIFALPTAAFLACAVFALLRSDGLRSRGWSVACGACIGLMLLSRTMAVAFVPAILLAAVLVGLVRGGGDLKNRTINLVLLALAGAAVAAIWYWHNLNPVVDYLTNYGYGTQSQYYGAEHAVISWYRIKDVANRMIITDLLAPLAVLALVGLIAGAALLFKRLWQAGDRKREATRILGSDAITVLVVFVLGFGALMTSRNGGNGFTFPLAILLPALAVVAIRGARKAVVIPVVAVVAAIGVLNVLASTDISESISDTRNVELPVFGSVPWVDGTPNAVDAMRVQVPGPADRFDARDKGWQELDAELADLLLEPIGPGRTQPLVGMAARHRAMNTNSITLSALLRHHAGIPFVQLEAEPVDTVPNYVNEIRKSPAGELTALITTSSEVEDFPPTVTQAKAEAAARKLGFQVIRRFKMPDGRQLRVWVQRS